MKYTHFASSKSSKISQKQLKKHERHKLGKRKASEVDFCRFLMIFGAPRGGQKCTKMEKMPSRNRSKKRRQKRKRPPPLLVECGGLRAANRNARFLLRKVFAMILGGSLYTPPLPAECGGLFCSLKRRPPHSTLGLMYVKKLIRILAVSGRTLAIYGRFLIRILAVSGRTLAIHGRILPQRMRRRSQKTTSRNHENSSTNRSKNAKIHQNRQKMSPEQKK